MPNYQAPSTGGTLRASNGNDTITGSAVNDTLWGLGGADVINSADGDDIVNGDGAYTVADAIRETGTANIAYAGTALSTTPVLTSMGMANGDCAILRMWHRLSRSNQPAMVMALMVRLLLRCRPTAIVS
jgi:hypothetical protein